MKRLLLPLSVSVAVWVLTACGGGGSGTAGDAPAGAQGAAQREQAGGRTPVAAPAGITAERVDARLRGLQGPVEVWVSLEQDSVAGHRARLAAAAGWTTDAGYAIKSIAALRPGVAAHRQSVRDAQGALGAQLASLGGSELARVQMAHNAIALRIDASKLGAVAALSGVARVRPLLHYELTLGETVPYVGGTAVQASGRDGSGVRVAVLDSGIDYTHRNLGGAGTAAAYAAAYGAAPGDALQTTRDGLFPTAKVVDGFDFVGEGWPTTARTEDPDPIDFEGHGSHVADIIAGRSLDGSHVGMAPGAQLVAVKTCSAISSSCNGIALLKGMDFALDPNGDGDTSDAVDVINMSLGSNYGQIEDDLSLASTNAVRLGVAVVTSAGNGANRPYIVGSPSIAPGVISVAQTAVPSAVAQPLVVNSPAAIAGVYGNTATMDFAPVGAGVTGDVAFVGRGCPAGSVSPTSPDDPFLVSPAGKIALIDRGACGVSLKIDRAVKAGATGVLIGLVAGGDAVSFSFAGGTDFAPSLVIQQTLSNAIKARLNAAQTVNVSISPAAALPLVGSMASTSSRGPSVSGQSIKPEIGAPGASLSAEAGTGNGQTAFGGTSGASPMVAGAVALLRQAYPSRSPEQIKAMLMNSAETTIYTNPALLPGRLAPITRIGAGELRVDRALALNAIAWNVPTQSAALSFGNVEADKKSSLTRPLRIENFSNQTRTFTVTTGFRYADDQASGAVKLSTRSSVTVGPRSRVDIDVRLDIDPTKLPSWTLNGGSLGGNGAALDRPEYDGYITLTDGGEKLSVPWHVLPRKAAATAGQLTATSPGQGLLKLSNLGTEVGEYDVFSLTGTSGALPKKALPEPGDNYAVIDLRSVGVRLLPAAVFGADYLEFAINTHGRRAHPNYPAEVDVYIDTTGDGAPDYIVYNAENGGFGATGQNLVFVADIKAGTPAQAFFFTDADLNSGNLIFTVPVNQGPGTVTVAPGATIAFDVYAFDNYFTGNLTDAIEGMRFTPGSERFTLLDLPFGSVAPNTKPQIGVQVKAQVATASTESGLLLMYRRNAGMEADLLKGN